jgi:NADPH:quinone reductase-like Zn-dependent oxidoreductase
MTITATMRALILKEDGFAAKPSGTVLEAMEPYVTPAELPVPAPGEGEVLIRVSVASINPSDVMFIKGMYGHARQKGRPAGFEGVGTVVASGGGAEADALLGRRVSFVSGGSGWGSWADYSVANAAGCIPLIDGVKDVDGAAMIVNPLTALAMFDIVRQEGEKAFILTAAASQLCKLIMNVAREEGFRPIAVVRREDQIPLLMAEGAAVVLNATAPDFAQRLAETCRAEKPRIFLDAVTGPLAGQIFASMPRRARWIVYGRLDSTTTPIPEPGQLIFMGKKIEGFWLTEWKRTTAKERRDAADLEAQKRFADGRWSTDVTAIVPLAEAMGRVPEELAKPNGKVFLTP